MTVHLVKYDGRPCHEEDQGAVTEQEAGLLTALAVALRPECIVEIGTGWNRSLRAFAEAQAIMDTMGWSCEIWTCDVDEGRIAAAKDVETDPRIHFIHGDCVTLAKAMPNNADLVFVDGNHTEQAVRMDFDVMRGKANSGATFVFHDPLVSPDVLAAVNALGIPVLRTPRGMAICSV